MVPEFEVTCVGGAGIQPAQPCLVSDCGDRHGRPDSNLATRDLPEQGWASSRYGEKHPCRVVRASFVAPTPFAAITFLSIPSHSIQPLPLETGSGVACTYTHGGFTDVAVLSTSDSEIVAGDFTMRGEFFWMRLEGRVLKQVLAVRAYSLDHGGVNIFRRLRPGPYLMEDTVCAEFAAS